MDELEAMGFYTLTAEQQETCRALATTYDRPVADVARIFIGMIPLPRAHELGYEEYEAWAATREALDG